MRAPPPVEYPSVPSRTWRSLLSLFVGASLASLVAWALPYVGAHEAAGQLGAVFNMLADPVAEAALALAVGGVGGVVVWLTWKSGGASERTLCWDGQDWVLAGAALGGPDQRGDAALMLDLGPWMLVRFVPYAAATGGFGAGTWLPLTLARDRARWAALRGALWNWRGESRAGAGRP
jgi:hypothetical protein